MLIITIQRWPFQPAKFDDNELPGASNFFLDDTGPALVVHAEGAVANAQLPLWAVDELPLVLTIVHEDYWQQLAVWPRQYHPSLPLWGADELPLWLGVDEDYWWQSNCWPKPLVHQLWVTDDELPLPAVTVVDEEYWQQFTGWSMQWANAVLPADGDDLPVFLFVDEEYHWQGRQWDQKQTGGLFTLSLFDTSEWVSPVGAFVSRPRRMLMGIGA